MRYLILLLTLLFASPVWGAAPTFDASTATAYIEGTTQSTNHTTSGSNRILCACISLFSTTETFSAVTYNGVAMTLVDSQSSAILTTYLYRLVAPASGLNAFSFTKSGSAAIRSNLTSYTDVDQTTPLGTAAKATSDDTTATVNVSSATGETVIDCVTIREDTLQSTPLIGAGQTQRGTFETDLVWHGKMSEEAGAGTVTMSWTWTNAQQWATVAVPLKPVSTRRAIAPIIFQ